MKKGMIIITLIFLLSVTLYCTDTLVYSTGFEVSDGFTASTTYNNTTIAYKGPTNYKWGTYFGTPSTNSPLSGSQSMQMRWYSSSPTSKGYTFTNFDIANASKVTFKAANTSTINVIVSYSIDQGVSYTGSSTYTLTTSTQEFTYIISETGQYPLVRIKFELSYSGSTNGTKLFLDDVKIYTIQQSIVNATTSSLSGFTYIQDLGPSYEQSFSVSGSDLTDNIILTPPVHYEISEGFGGSFVATNPITLEQRGGSIGTRTIYTRLKADLAIGDYNEDISITSTDATSKTVTCSGSVTAQVPTIFVEERIDFNNQTINTLSDTESYLVTGVFLTNDIIITPPDGFEISTLEESGYISAPSTLIIGQTGGNVSASVYVRFKPTEVKTYSETINHTSIGAESKTVAVTGTGLETEPTNHVTAFSTVAGTPSYNSIIVSWTDASTGSIPEAYLIKASTSSITDPVDGIPETNDTLVRNVAQGIQTYTFTGLTPNTTYNFKIYPYTNSGSYINYKIDESVPTSQLTTSIRPFLEDFETATNQTNYSIGSYTLDTGQWIFDDALTGNLANDHYNGTIGVRVRNSGNIAMNFNKLGCSQISFYHSVYGTNAEATLKLFISYNDGANYSQLGSDIACNSTTLTQTTFTVNTDKAFRIKITKSGGERINIDDITITDFDETAEDESSQTASNTGVDYDYHVDNGQYSVRLHPEANLGNTSVKVKRGTKHPSVPSGTNTVKRYVTINPANQNNANLFIRYQQNELNGLTETNLCLFRKNGSTWQRIDNSVVDVDNNIVSATNVVLLNAKAPNEFIIAERGESTLPVTLSSFTAVPNAENASVSLNWVTQSENDMLGYYVYRNTNNNQASAERKSNLVVANNQTNEQTYTWNDTEISEGDYYYWLMSVERNGASELYGPITVKYINPDTQNPPVIESVTAFNTIYPNPFNPCTTLSYTLKDGGNAFISIYNVKGELINRYNEMGKTAGEHKLVWNGKDLNNNEVASGVYFFKFESGKTIQMKKAMLLK